MARPKGIKDTGPDYMDAVMKEFEETGRDMSNSGFLTYPNVGPFDGPMGTTQQQRQLNARSRPASRPHEKNVKNTGTKYKGKPT